MKRVIGPSGKKYYVGHRKNEFDGSLVIEVCVGIFRTNIHTHYTHSYSGCRIVEFYKNAVAEYEDKQSKTTSSLLARWDGDMRNE